MGTTPTRLEVITEARTIAERIGAVKDGNNFFEKQNGELRDVGFFEVREGLVKPDELCGVCIAGACMVAELLSGNPESNAWAWTHDAAAAARDVLDADDRDIYEGDEIARAITDKGLPYVLAVLDRMVEREAEAVAA